MLPPRPREVYRRLLRAYGPQGWWPLTPPGGGSPVYRPGREAVLTERERAEICVGAILTQNTNWGNVQRALEGLHGAGVWGLRDILRLSSRRLESLIRPSGYFRQKARKLRVFARHALKPSPRSAAFAAGASRPRSLGAWLSGALKSLRRELLGLWGVGPETADSILLYAGGRPVFVVDAYTLRIGSRLGWFGKAGYERVQSYLVRRLPTSPKLYAELHALLVALAKGHCRAKPVCAGCPLLELCRHGRAALRAGAAAFLLGPFSVLSGTSGLAAAEPPASTAAEKADVLVVLGAGSPLEGWANPMLSQRVCRGVLEYRKEAAGRLLFSGGYTAGHIAEAEMMRVLALGMGVRPEDALMESASETTAANSRLCTAIAKKEGWRRILLVSHRGHFPRAQDEFAKAGQGFYERITPVLADGAEPAACFGLEKTASIAGSSPRQAPFDMLIVDLRREEKAETSAAREPTALPAELLELVRRAGELYLSGQARRLYFAAPYAAGSSSATYGLAAGAISITELARILAAGMGVAWDDILITSGRRYGGVPGAIEPEDNPWLRIPGPRLAVLSPGPQQGWWREHFSKGLNAALAEPEFLRSPSGK